MFKYNSKLIKTFYRYNGNCSYLFTTNVLPVFEFIIPYVFSFDVFINNWNFKNEEIIIGIQFTARIICIHYTPRYTPWIKIKIKNVNIYF